MLKTEFTQAEVATLPFAHHVLRQGIQSHDKVPIDAEGNHWHVTDVHYASPPQTRVDKPFQCL